MLCCVKYQTHSNLTLLVQTSLFMSVSYHSRRYCAHHSRRNVTVQHITYMKLRVITRYRSRQQQRRQHTGGLEVSDPGRGVVSLASVRRRAKLLNRRVPAPLRQLPAHYQTFPLCLLARSRYALNPPCHLLWHDDCTTGKCTGHLQPAPNAKSTRTSSAFEQYKTPISARQVVTMPAQAKENYFAQYTDACSSCGERDA